MTLSNIAATKILIVGGSYGGVAALKSIITSFSATPPSKKISVTLIEPRGGFVNILGIPKSIIDVDFADKTYSKIENWNVKFDNIISKDEKLVKLLKSSSLPSIKGLSVKYIQGKCIDLSPTAASYQLSNISKEHPELSSDSLVDETPGTVDYDYCIFATGRKRSWPFDPLATTPESFHSEMSDAFNTIKPKQKISIIGGGALGIEIAGELKCHFPEKIIRLIHPYDDLPPEPLIDPLFKKMTRELLEKVGIELHLGKRVSIESPNGDLTLNDGTKLKSDLNYWCTSHPNNTQPLSKSFPDSIDEKGQAKIDSNMQLQSSTKNNIFVVGDIINYPVIKSAGAALHMGQYAAANLINLINDKPMAPLPPAELWPKGMVIAVGLQNLIAQRDAVIGEADAEVVDMYSDYCTRRSFEGLEIK